MIEHPFASKLPHSPWIRAIMALGGLGYDMLRWRSYQVKWLLGFNRIMVLATEFGFT